MNTQEYTNGNGHAQEEDDDLLGVVPESSGSEQPLMEPGDYDGFLKALKVVKKSDDAFARDTAKEEKQAKDDGRDVRVVDAYQWEWTFGFSDPALSEFTIRDWTSRSLHPRATAHKYASKLMGRDLEPGEPIQKSALIGQPCRITLIVHKSASTGNTRNYVESIGTLRRGGAAVGVGGSKAMAPSVRSQSMPASTLTQRLQVVIENLEYPPDKVLIEIASLFHEYRETKMSAQQVWKELDTEQREAVVRRLEGILRTRQPQEAPQAAQEEEWDVAPAEGDGELFPPQSAPDYDELAQDLTAKQEAKKRVKA